MSIQLNLIGDRSTGNAIVNLLSHTGDYKITGSNRKNVYA